MNEVRVFDADGNERDMEWAVGKYNLPPIEEAPRDKDHWEVVALYENTRDSSMTIRVSGADIAGVTIAFGWPDGLDFQETNAEGQTGFGMGIGAYYNPKERQGPHFAHVLDVIPTDCVQGLGMIGGTEHDHLEPTFRFVQASEEPEPAEDRTFRFEGVVTLTEV